MSKRNWIILANILYWFFEAIRNYVYYPEAPHRVVETTSWIFFNACFFYFNYFILVPKLLQPKSTWLTFYWLLSLLVSYAFFFYIHCYLFKIVSEYNANPMELDWGAFTQLLSASTPSITDRFIGFTAHIVVYFGSLSTASRLLYDWYQNNEAHQAMIAKQREVELNPLKSSFNTSFLLYALDTIKSHLADDSEKAKNSILELSSVLRHTLYQTSDKRIELKLELEALQSLIDIINHGNESLQIRLSSLLTNEGLYIKGNAIIHVFNSWYEQIQHHNHTQEIKLELKETQLLLKLPKQASISPFSVQENIKVDNHQFIAYIETWNEQY